MTDDKQTTPNHADGPKEGQKTPEDILQAWKADLLALKAMAADSTAPVTLDQQSVGRLSRMDAMQQQAMAQAQDRKRDQDLLRIEAALMRVRDDEYGYCVECGDEIAAKRLAIDPAATLCIGCASLNE